MTTNIFVSYRRDDAAAEANSIVQFVKGCVGEDSVFFDTSSISPGESWPDKLKNKIEAAKTVIAVIGPDWVRVADQWGRRRIDNPEDWVRREIETALSSNAKLLPVLVRTAHMPPREVLPESIQEITSKQAIELRRDFWDHDIQLLLAQFAETTESSSNVEADSGPFPRSPNLPPDPIAEEKLAKILKTELPDWSQFAAPLPSEPGKVRFEITREFKFKSFQSAIKFMAEVAPGCDISNHHPRWENIWETLTVSLSTWDGRLHKVTDRDVMLAKYFDRAYGEFEGRVGNVPNKAN